MYLSFNLDNLRDRLIEKVSIMSGFLRVSGAGKSGQPFFKIFVGHDTAGYPPCHVFFMPLGYSFNSFFGGIIDYSLISPNGRHQ